MSSDSKKSSKSSGSPATPQHGRTANDGEYRTEQLTFHYDRSERLSQRLTPVPNMSGGWLRGNRSLIILLVDAAIVVILFFIFLFVLQPMSRERSIGPFHISGRAVRFDQEILISVKVRAAEESDQVWQEWHEQNTAANMTDQPLVRLSVPNREMPGGEGPDEPDRPVAAGTPTAGEEPDRSGTAGAMTGTVSAPAGTVDTPAAMPTDTGEPDGSVADATAADATEPDGAGSSPTTQDLTPRPGNERILRLKVADSGSDSVRAVITIRDETRTLNLSISDE